MKILPAIGLLLFTVIPAFAEEQICFDTSVAGRMVVELERGRIQKDALDIYKQSAENLEAQIKEQNEVIDVYRDSFIRTKENIEQYKHLLDEQRALYEAEIKNTRPGLIERIVTGAGFMGLGAVIAGLLILL